MHRSKHHLPSISPLLSSLSRTGSFPNPRNGMAVGDGAVTDLHDDLYGAGSGSSNWTEAVVKMKLATFCPDVQIRRAIDACVMDCNIIVAEAYALAELHIARVLESVGDISLKSKADWERLYYQCLISVCATGSRAVRDTTIPSDVSASACALDTLRPVGDTKVDGARLGEIIPDLRKTMATAAVNSLNMKAPKHFSRYLRWRYPAIRTYHPTVVAMVLRHPRMPLDKVDRLKTVAKNGRALASSTVAKRTCARKLIEDLRTRYPIRSGVEKMYASTASAVVPLLRDVLCETEAHLATNPKRTAARRFTLMPQKQGFTISNIPICTRAMLRIVGGLRRHDGSRLCTINSPAGATASASDVVWRGLFNVNAVETATRRFGHQIVTDGCSVSVLMKTNRAHVVNDGDITESWQLGNGSSGRPVAYVGVDPGVTDVVTAATYSVRGGEPVISSYSSSRYYHDAKFKLSNRRTNRWNTETKSLGESLKVDASRSTVHGTSQAISAFLAAFRKLLAHRAERGYRNMRFLRHVHKQRTVAKICDLLAPSDRLSIIGFGDWSGVGDTPIQRRFCGPLQDIKRELRHRAAQSNTVRLGKVWEYRTSVTDHMTWTPLTNMVANRTVRTRDGEREVKRARIHKVLHARNSVVGFGHTKTTWNRDANAARNILMLMMMQLHGMCRPQVFKPSRARRRR